MKKKLEIFQVFHEKTKINNSVNEIGLKNYPKLWTEVDFKAYARLMEIKLAKPKKIKKSLSQVLFKRESTRKFTNKKINLNDISQILFYTAGLRKNMAPWFASRFYPSAGSRYPLEIYLLSLNTELNKGLYHYYPKNHSLEKLLSIKKILLNQYFSNIGDMKPSLFILITAVFQRTIIKYGNRGYRHILLEAGHLGQNVYLISSGLNLGVCAIGGFVENKLNALIDIDGTNESIIYALALGHYNKSDSKTDNI